MIKKFYYPKSEYYIYYGVNDGNPVGVDLSNWPEVIRNEMVSSQEGRLVFYTIPTYIPDGAFDQLSIGNNNLTHISLPNTITNIGEGAFSGCSNITSFTLRDEVTTVGDSAFGGTGITLPLYNSTIFAYLPNSYSGSYTIPSGITTITGFAAFDCDSLTTLIVPDSVTNIGYEAFMGCGNLVQVEIGTGVTNIGEYAFLNIGVNGTFICKATNPPTIDTSFGSPGISWTLYVPSNSVSAYQADSKWSNAFSSIQAIQT